MATLTKRAPKGARAPRTKPADNAESLHAYVRETRRRECYVCQHVPPALEAIIRESRIARKYSLTICLGWLKQEHGIEVTREQWRAHTHALHKEV